MEIKHTARGWTEKKYLKGFQKQNVCVDNPAPVYMVYTSS